MATYTNNSKSSSAFSNGSKNSASFANASKSMRAWGTFTFDEVGNLTFNDVVLADGTTVANVTFDTLVDLVWNNQSKN